MTGKLDWLGMDDGSRALPSGYDYTDINGYPTAIQEIQEDPSIEAFTREFNPTLGVRSAPAFLNTSLSTSYGNQYQLGESANAWLNSRLLLSEQQSTL